jgi:hypothetical protein
MKREARDDNISMYLTILRIVANIHFFKAKNLNKLFLFHRNGNALFDTFCCLRAKQNESFIAAVNNRIDEVAFFIAKLFLPAFYYAL